MLSFDVVDEKLEEADFFLEKLSESNTDWTSVRFYFSAFVSAARSVTFSMQAVMAHIVGFEQWYGLRKEELKKDPAARFFHEARTQAQHQGINPVNAGSMRTGPDGKPVVKYTFTDGMFGLPKGAPTSDVETACRQYQSKLVRLVWECYRDFGPYIDPAEYYTLNNLARLGLSLDDVAESMGFPRDWASLPGATDEERLRLLTSSIPGCQIGWIFEKYGCLPEDGEVS